MIESKQLKIETRQLPNIQSLLNDFEQQLPSSPHPDIQHKFTTIKKFLNELAYSQVVNEKIASLAHHLHDLHIASLTHDTPKVKHIVSLFLNDPHANIKQLIFEVAYLESQLSLLHQSYTSMLDDAKNLPLEESIAFLSSSPNKPLKHLLDLSEKQKQYVKLIGQKFVSLTRTIHNKPKKR